MTKDELGAKLRVISKPCVDGAYFQVVAAVTLSFGEARKGTIIFVGNDKSVRRVTGKEKKGVVACL